MHRSEWGRHFPSRTRPPGRKILTRGGPRPSVFRAFTGPAPAVTQPARRSDDRLDMSDGFEKSVRGRRKEPREVDVVEGALLLAFFLVGLTALVGKLHQMLS